MSEVDIEQKYGKEAFDTMLLKGEPVGPAMLVPEYDRMFAKNDYLVEVGR